MTLFAVWMSTSAPPLAAPMKGPPTTSAARAARSASTQTRSLMAMPSTDGDGLAAAVLDRSQPAGGRQTAPGRVTARLAARLSGRMPATTVEALLRAGEAAYEDLFTAEELRHGLVVANQDLWSLGAGVSSQFVATWCAFALQTLGEELVKSEYAAEPRLAGYLPAMTAEQAGAFLDAAGTWSARARRAAADQGYDLAAEVRLPAPLPSWRRTGPCTNTHIGAMLAAARALRDRAQAALADFCALPAPAEHAGAADRLRGVYAEAEAAIGQAGQMWAPSRDQHLHQAVEGTLDAALGQLFWLGQVLARPRLLDPGGSAAGSAARARPLPGEPGFDPWCLTDPAACRSLADDPAARSALEHLWRNDPNPAATLALAAEVEEEVARGTVRADGDGSYYYCTPWPPIYTVRRPVSIANHNFAAGQQFTLDICVGGHHDGTPGFRRGLLAQSFQPASRLGYCDQMERAPGGC